MFMLITVHSNRALLARGIRAYGGKSVSIPNCGQGMSMSPPYLTSCARVNRCGKGQAQAGRDLR